MRQTYTKLLNTFYDYVSQSSGSFASSDIAAFGAEHSNEGMHFIQRELKGYIVQDLPHTASTVEDQQYYHYPPSTYPPITSVTVTNGDIAYPLEVVQSQDRWDKINKLDFSATMPQFIFPRRDDFGIYPIPAADGETITFISGLLAKDMSVVDYTTGTVTVTSNDATVAGSGTTFTASMVGRWFKTDTDWYRIASFTSTTSIELETVYEGTTTAGASYTIGESPEIPPELHPLIPHFVAGKFYAGPRKDFASAQAHTNYFWTGDYTLGQNTPLSRVYGGLLGAKKRYASRDGSAIVNRRKRIDNMFLDSLWSSELS